MTKIMQQSDYIPITGIVNKIDLINQIQKP